MNEKMEKLISGSYGMYTTAGNKSIENKFRVLISKLEKENLSCADKVKAAESLVKSWRKMGNSQTMSEASDTAVREAVWDVLINIGKEFRISYEVCNWIWDNTY